jgi:hypothetical protein
MIAIAVSSVDVAPAHALAINGAATGISNPAQTIDFNDLTVPNGTPVTTQYPGVTFSGTFASSYTFPNVSGRNIENFGNLISIQFSTTQTRVAFALVSNPTTTTFTALLNGAVVESFTASTNVSSSNNFYGFIGSSGFNAIQIFDDGVGAAIDNLQIGDPVATPVPFGFTPLPGLAVSGLLCGVNRLRKRFAEEHAEV